jgi:hypothetical protein
MQRPWFGPKKLGWGLSPITWQGWALTAAMVVTVVVLALTMAAHQLWLFGTLFAITVALFLLVAYLTSTFR